MPLHRRNSAGHCEENYLEEITEAAELEDELLHQITCSASKDFLCLRGAGGEKIFDVSCSVKLLCNNPNCTQSRFLHSDCFETWQQELIVKYFNRSKEGQKKTRNWSEKQKLQNLWKPQGYSLVSEACACNCGGGLLRKDLNWIPPKSSSSNSGQNSDSEKQKRRRKKSSKNNKTALTIGLPTFVNGLQIVKRSDNQGIPSNRQRTNSMSSSHSGSSSWGSSHGSPATSPPSDTKMPPRQVNMRDRSRHDSGGSIFFRRNDYSAFNVLPRQKINSYHIKMEDECSIGNDETRCFILSSYATHKMNKVPCVLCNSQMIIFERYPLIDGTFFISPRQHTSSCIQVKAEGRICYLSAICMGCLEGWSARLQCRNQSCKKVWDGSQLILGTMYSYDIFAAVPCCADRLKCNSCGQLVIHPDRSNFFSDYSQTVSCPQCGVQDFHFVKPLKHSFLTKDDMSRMSNLSSNNIANNMSNMSSLSSQLSWARITANS